MKITCIDFETANPFYGSVCAIGIAIIDDGKIQSVKSQLIKPHPKYGIFNRDNIRVHGITKEMVKDAPEFNAHYETVKHLIENSMVAAHNTVFDTAVLKDVLTIYGIAIPSFEYICSCELAQSLWKDSKNHKLHTISRYLNYKFKHHDAGEDAGACANIIVEGMKLTGISDIRELAKYAGVTIGTIAGGEPHVLSKDYLDTEGGTKKQKRVRQKRARLQKDE